MSNAWKAGEEYGRRLPHLQPKDGVFFVTPRLDGSLPKFKIKALQIQRERIVNELKRTITNEKDLKKELLRQHELYFMRFDNLLDNPDSGPTWLKNAKLAKITYDAFLHFDQDRYKIICFTIMSNHAHAVLYKLDRPLYKIMHSIKRFSGRESNKLLDRIGHAYWLHEGYDHWIRDRESLAWKITYTLNNPIKAGLVNNWRDWPHTYIHPDFEKFILDWVDDKPPKLF